MAAKNGGVLRWTPNEYVEITRAVAPLIKAGVAPVTAILQAQSVLPKNRRHPKEVVDGQAIRKRLAGYCLKLGLLPATAFNTPRPKGSKSVTWSPTEWALIARRVKYWRDTMKDSRPGAKLFLAAARIELPPDRQRGLPSLQASTVKKNLQLVADGLKNGPLIASRPFDPNRTSFEPTGQVFEFIDESKLPKPTEKPASSSQAAPNPPAGTTPPKNPADAAGSLTFTVTAGPAVVEVMRSMISQAVANELDARIPTALIKITSHLQASIASMLTHFLDAKPGDVVAAPPAPAMPEPPAAKAIQEVKLPLLDVVGLIGPQINQVKDSLNGHAKQVRFVDADNAGSWTPRGVVILNTKFISHNAEDKCKKAGVKPIRVNGGADAVLRALNELYVQAGNQAAAAMHH